MSWIRAHSLSRRTFCCPKLVWTLSQTLVVLLKVLLDQFKSISTSGITRSNMKVYFAVWNCAIKLNIYLI